uniref:Uncharacterized protein n=1 Tax=Oryza barthii TaxID=65489 RepID=A0A0D3GGT6_9ORYZ
MFGPETWAWALSSVEPIRGPQRIGFARTTPKARVQCCSWHSKNNKKLELVYWLIRCNTPCGSCSRTANVTPSPNRSYPPLIERLKTPNKKDMVGWNSKLSGAIYLPRRHGYKT